MVRIAAFYFFAPVDEPTALRDRMLAVAQRLDLKGAVLVATEGINGTVAGTGRAVEAFLDEVRADPRFAAMRASGSTADRSPFHRLRVQVREEIVAMRAGQIDVTASTGIKVAPADWDELIARPDVTVVDTRNHFEVVAGSFPGAIDPGTGSFNEFAAWVEEAGLDRDLPVAMFCTGGIRCEKASAWMVEQGFTEVYQLAGGILSYLEDVPIERQSWQGECVVFDARRTVDRSREAGTIELCHTCSMPVLDPTAPEYEPGVQCPICAERLDDATRARFRERRRQIELAERRGKRHVGPRPI